MLGRVVGVFHSLLDWLYGFFFRLGIRVRERSARSHLKSLKSAKCAALVGDGIAEGYGDLLARGGLAHRMQKIVAVEGRDPPLSLHLPWIFVSVARYGWTSGQVVDEVRKVWGTAGSNSPAVRASAALVFCSGVPDFDAGVEPHQIAANIVQAARILANGGVYVSVASVPVIRLCDKSKVLETNKRLQEKVGIFSKSSKNYIESELSPDMVKFSQQRALCLTEGSDTVSSHGFRLLTRISIDALRNQMKREEWKTLSPRLSAG